MFSKANPLRIEYQPTMISCNNGSDSSSVVFIKNFLAVKVCARHVLVVEQGGKILGYASRIGKIFL